ncbi:TIGR03943 family putative permease subunit [Umezawaea tangerina]|uniref:Putative repeat protein (TIGR03943 family) n=1 Tax=Umezawaea tangerina TaxID=84725 RepID=A0A2T0SRU5_9PSEU|nr:TIGR03943 family protein [Umezawaea tangerina]PRY36129.1 putative repeat protein (TIGR03943 family) [Umezawaea tangerina]
MRRETQNILLILLGGALLKLSFTDMYLRYVKAGLQPLLIAAGAVMILLAVIAIARDLKGAKDTEDTAHAGGHAADSHDAHGHKASRSPWMLLLPVLAVFLISPPALGADTVNRSDRNAAQETKKGNGFAALPAGDVLPMSLTEFVTRTAWDDSGSLDDRTVKLTGFVVRKNDATYVARLAISCCAADASPIKVRMTGSGFEAMPTDQWVEVTGKVVPGSATKDTAYVPTFTVSDIAPIATPTDTYES